jgi:hypothetical protein
VKDTALRLSFQRFCVAMVFVLSTHCTCCQISHFFAVA